MTYQLTGENWILRINDEAHIPMQQGAPGYAEYQDWLAEGNTPLPTNPPSAEQIMAEVVAGTQARLDAFARTRNYDGILSACTYATSTVPQFQAEGKYCVNARDATWAVLYQLMAEVEAGTRPMPAGFADIESELPPLAWLE